MEKSEKGWFVIVSKNGLEQIKSIEKNLFLQKKLTRSKYEDSVLMDSQEIKVAKNLKMNSNARIHTHWQVAESRPKSQNLPKSLASQALTKKARAYNIVYDGHAQQKLVTPHIRDR